MENKWLRREYREEQLTSKVFLNNIWMPITVEVS